MKPEDQPASTGERSPSGDRQSPFGSVLTVPEFAFADAAGLVPIAPVMGCEVRWLSVLLPLPVYRTRTHPASPLPDESYEEDVISIAELDVEVTQARHRAFDRLREEATRAGADAVIGVRQVDGPIASGRLGPELGKLVVAARPGPHPYLTRPLEFQLIGTAVRDPANRSPQPHVSTVSASEFWNLRRGGWHPVGVAGGCSHRFGASMWASSVACEVQGSTAIWATARQAAFEQLKTELSDLAADGVVGVSIDVNHETFDWKQRVGHSTRDRQGMLVAVSIIGTAIRRAARPAGDAQGPTRILTLR